MKPYLIVDSNNLCHIAHYSTGELSNEEKRTGTIFGFLNKVLKLSKVLKSNKFVFCFDSKKSYRKQIYPEYKANRNKQLTDQEREEKHFLYDQIDELKKEILIELGFRNVFYQAGYEADDIIAWASKNIEGEKVLVSTDGDLYQLLSFVDCIYNPVKKTKYTKKDFFSDWSFDCDRWGNIKAITGCNTDNVKGIKGIGNKTAMKFLSGAIEHGSPQWEKITGNYDKINFNKRLVCLPFESGKPIRCSLVDDELKKSNFIRVFDKLRFASFLKEDALQSWTRNFELED